MTTELEEWKKINEDLDVLLAVCRGFRNIRRTVTAAVIVYFIIAFLIIFL